MVADACYATAALRNCVSLIKHSPATPLVHCMGSSICRIVLQYNTLVLIKTAHLLNWMLGGRHVDLKCKRFRYVHINLFLSLGSRSPDLQPTGAGVALSP